MGRLCSECSQSSGSNLSKPLLCCGYCSNAVHPNCFSNSKSSIPELMALPNGVWVCPSCISVQKLESRVVMLKALRNNRSNLTSPIGSPAPVPLNPIPTISMPPIGVLSPLPNIKDETRSKSLVSNNKGSSSPSSALELMKSNRKMSLSGKTEGQTPIISYDPIDISPTVAKDDSKSAAPPSATSTPCSVPFSAPSNTSNMMTNGNMDLNNRKTSPYVFSNQFNSFHSPFIRPPYGSGLQPPSPLINSIPQKVSHSPHFASPSPRISANHSTIPFPPVSLPATSNFIGNPTFNQSLKSNGAALLLIQDTEPNSRSLNSSSPSNIMGVLHDHEI